MRTNIVLNDDLIQEAQRYSRSRSKKALIEEALRAYIQLKSEEQRLLDYRERVQKLDERLSGLVLRQSPHSVLRADRDRT